MITPATAKQMFNPVGTLRRERPEEALPCVGWGLHTRATAQSDGQQRVCWACEAKGYRLTRQGAP